MKSLLVALAFSPLIQTQSFNEESSGMCRSIGVAARHVMEARQSGLSLMDELKAYSDSIENVDASAFEASKIYLKLIISAWSLPVQTNRVDKNRMIDIYSSEIEKACNKEF